MSRAADPCFYRPAAQTVVMAKMPLELLNNVEHWRERAEEARVHADQMIDPKAKEVMLGIADGYDRIAERAEQRRRDRPREGGRA